ncbi:MAG: Crp/Fnr family transcriptional regulator [Myxococcota bacterium]|jgi:CRP-like cAMP-binding protein|nr:Crp/Fnr family transcriptional regulator [Myxococcota bacterium]
MSQVSETSISRREACESIRAIPIFREASDHDLETLASHLIERKFPKDAIIVDEGLAGDYMYVIRSGRVKVTKASNDGREKIMNLFGAGDFFGEMSLLDNQPRSASVSTLEPTLLLALSRRDFMELLKNSFTLALCVIQELTRRLRDTGEQASSISFQKVQERTRGLFERIALDEGSGDHSRITPTLTHQQIADMIGTSRETVTRAVKRLKEDGWLQQRGKRYVIPPEDHFIS